MRKLRAVLLRLGGLFNRQRRAAEFDDELESNLQMQIEDNLRAGMSPEDARYAALRKFGNVTRVREDVWEVRSFAWLEQMWEDVRFSMRVLAKNRGFTTVAVLTLALGIGATTAIFTVVNAVLLRPLPYPQPDRLVYIRGNTWGPFSGGREYLAWKGRSQALTQIAAYMEMDENLAVGDEAERVTSGTASASFFQLLGVHPLLGRLFNPEEDQAGTSAVAIISYGLWQRRFRSDPSVIGRALTVDGRVYTVIGVLPASFLVPDRYGSNCDLWMPLPAGALVMERIAGGASASAVPTVVRVIGRLRSGRSYLQARSELDTILQPTLTKGTSRHAVVVPWQRDITSAARLPLLVSLAAVSFLLLIACVNVAHLMLSRVAARQKEMAVRLAVGAGRPRIVRQFLTESALLALFGGLVGLVLAHWVKDLLVAFISPNLPTLEPINVDYRVLGFSLALAGVTGLTFGLAPALQASKVSLNEVLKEANRSTAESRSGALLRKLLVMSETALAVALLVGAGLLFRSFLQMRGVEMGFRSDHILTLTIDLTPSNYPTPNDQARFFQRVIENIKNLPGVQWVGGSDCPPLVGRSGTIDDLPIEGRPERIPVVSLANVTPNYFRTLGIPLKRGRYFNDADRDGAPSVAIVSESIARRYFRGENCLGRKVGGWVQKDSWLTIVGVVGDVRSSLEGEPESAIYVPYLQAGEPFMTLLARTSGSPMLWANDVRKQVESIDKNQPAHGLATLEELEARSLTPRRVNMLLFAAFAVLGLILASVGIYGVVSYSVSQRTHELGIRMALGAEHGNLVRVAVGQGLRSVLIGTGMGVATSFGLTRFLQSMLFGVRPTDPATFVAVPLLLLAVAWLACYVPARRATKVDPMMALRYE